MAKHQPFTIVERRGRFVVYGHDGQPIGTFSTRQAAERHAEANRRIFETVADGTGLPKPTTARAQEQLADPASATAGRTEAAGPAQRSLFAPAEQIVKAATKPVDKPAQPDAGELPLTARQMKRMLAGQRPKGSPKPTRALSATPPPKPPIARSPGPKIRTVYPLARLAPKKNRGGRGAKPPKPRRSKMAVGTVPIQSSEQPGAGFVLDNPATSVTARDLTRMLGQAPPRPPAPENIAASPPEKTKPEKRARRKPRESGASLPTASLPTATAITAAGPLPPLPPRDSLPQIPKAITQMPAGSKPPVAGQPSSASLSLPPLPPRPVGPGIPKAIVRMPAGSKPPVANQAQVQPAQTNVGQPRQPKSQPNSLTAVLKKLTNTLATLAKSLGGQKSGQSNQAGPGGKGKGKSAATQSQRGGFGATVAKFFGLGAKTNQKGQPKHPAAGAGSKPAGVRGAIGGIMGNVAGGAAVATGGVALVAGGLAKLGAELMKAPLEIESFTSGLLEGQQDLRQFNAGIANSFAMLERQKMILAGRTASGTSGTTKALADSQAELREALQPMQELGKNIMNVVGTGLNKAGTYLAKIMKYAAFIESIDKLIKDLLDIETKKEQEVMPAAQFIDDIAKGNWGGPKNQRP